MERDQLRAVMQCDGRYEQVERTHREPANASFMLLVMSGAGLAIVASTWIKRMDSKPAV